MKRCIKLLGEKEEERSVGRILRNLALSLFTDNLFRSALNMNLLPLIIFSPWGMRLTSSGRLLL